MDESVKVRWRPGCKITNTDPEPVLNELTELTAANDGELFPEAVVDAAKKKRSALHGYFEWDDTKAANEHRLTQARRLIRCVEVVRPEAPDKGYTRAFQVARSKRDGKGQSYQQIEDIMADPDRRAELIQRALMELLAIRRKYHQLQELAIVFRELDAVVANYKP